MPEQLSAPPMTVSVIIRNRNEAESLKYVLESVAQQQSVQVEIIIVDNESEDDSVKIAEKYKAKILTLPKDSFTYGKALNMGLEAAQGEICVLLSAHSMMVSPYFLYAAALPFRDKTIAAARCLHLGKQYDIKQWIKPRVLEGTLDVDLIVSKGPLANGCAIRREVWKEIPFNETVIAAEEKMWAMEVLRRGYKILSLCPAPYEYLKTTSVTKSVYNEVNKNNKEIQAIFDETGVRTGHLKETAFYKLRKFSYQIVTMPFITTYRVMIRAYLEFKLLVRLLNK